MRDTSSQSVMVGMFQQPIHDHRAYHSESSAGKDKLNICLFQKSRNLVKMKISKWLPAHSKVKLGEILWKVTHLWPCRSNRGNVWCNWWLKMTRHMLCLSQKDKIRWWQEFQNGRLAIMRSTFGQKILPTCNFRAFWSARGNLILNIWLEMTRQIIYPSN